ncbi:Gfo/Idh/MocA family oxidoreductase [Patescibacteria group bacterium]|nr:Gfo/Idh/MocA family oxidoreductase [Patescibacteria group bacterium]MCG2699920.1 Gfo/Idh/MocA family oxidoreductase [Candidatus Parcubacteria bacterium]
MKNYKATVIGCGRIGAEEWRYQKNIKPATHAAAYWNHPKIELAGLCDIDSRKLKKTKKFFPGVPLYSSARKMLKEIEPDIVSVATHPDTHFKFVKMAAESGVKAIICEKPMSDSFIKAESMVKICEEKKCLLFISHLRHFDPLIRKWQEKVKKGLLGKISQVNCFYHNGFFNNATHTVDLLRWFLGEVGVVSGFYNLETSNLEKDKNIDAIVCFKNKSNAILHSLPQKRGFTEWFFYGEKGELAIKKLGMEISYKNLKIGKPRSLMAPMVSHIVSCLEGKEKPLSTDQDGLAVLKILFALEKSAENNGKVITIA